MSPDRLDRERLQELLALTRPGGPDLLVKLIDVFLRELPARLDALREAVDAADAAASAEAAHALKGSSATLGAQKLARLCDEIEAAASTGDHRRPARLLPEVVREAADTGSALAAVAGRRAAPG